MPSFAQVLARPRKGSRQSRPASLLVPALILRLVTWQRMSFSDPLVWSGISGRSSTISNQAVLADIELTGVVADNDGVGQEAMQLDAAPRGALGGEHDGIG